ncbi:MAG: hypothetical protein ACREBG_24500, partial [Pyrinomonadaceae bacterium]
RALVADPSALLVQQSKNVLSPEWLILPCVTTDQISPPKLLPLTLFMGAVIISVSVMGGKLRLLLYV